MAGAPSRTSSRKVLRLRLRDGFGPVAWRSRLMISVLGAHSENVCESVAPLLAGCFCTAGSQVGGRLSLTHLLYFPGTCAWRLTAHSSHAPPHRLSRPFPRLNGRRHVLGEFRRLFRRGVGATDASERLMQLCRHHYAAVLFRGGLCFPPHVWSSRTSSGRSTGLRPSDTAQL